MLLSKQLAYCKTTRQPRIADEQITWFYAKSLEDGAAFLQMFGTEIKGLKQEDECRIFQTAKEHFCGVCNTRPAPTCPAGPEGPSAEPVTTRSLSRTRLELTNIIDGFKLIIKLSQAQGRPKVQVCCIRL